MNLSSRLLGDKVDRHHGFMSLLCDSDLITVARGNRVPDVLPRLHAEFFVRLWLYEDRCPEELRSKALSLPVSDAFITAFRTHALILRNPDNNSQADHEKVLSIPDFQGHDRAVWRALSSRLMQFLNADGVFPLAAPSRGEAMIVPFTISNAPNRRNLVYDEKKQIPEWTRLLSGLSNAGSFDKGVEIHGEFPDSFIEGTDQIEIGSSLGLAFVLAFERQRTTSLAFFYPPLQVVSTGSFQGNKLQEVDEVFAKIRAARQIGARLVVWPGQAQEAKAAGDLPLDFNTARLDCIERVRKGIEFVGLHSFTFHRACLCVTQARAREPRKLSNWEEIADIRSLLESCRETFKRAIDDSAPSASQWLSECNLLLRQSLSRYLVLRYKASAVIGTSAILLLILGWFWQEARNAELARTAQIARLTEQGKSELWKESPMRAIPYLSSAYQLGGTGTVLRLLLGQSLNSLDSQVTSFGGPSNPIGSPGFSSDSARILCHTATNGAAIWDAKSGNLIVKLADVSDPVIPPVFSLDGSHIATVRREEGLIWNAADGELLHRLKGHTLDIKSIAFSPDGARVTTSSVDDTSKVWDSLSGALLVSLKGHAATVRSAVFTPGGNRVLTTSVDGTAKLWEARTGSNLATFAISPEPLAASMMAMLYTSISPDERQLLIVVPAKFARLFDTTTGSLLAHFDPNYNALRSATFAHDGKQALAFVASKSSHDIEVFDIAMKTKITTLQGHSGGINSVAVSPDGSQFLTTSWDTTARIWDAITGKPLMVIEGHQGFVLSFAAYNGDGRRVVTADSTGLARIWNIAAAKLPTSIHAHSAIINSLRFSHDGTQIVTASNDRTVKVWDSRTLTSVLELNGFKCPVNDARFDSRRTRIITISSAGRYPLLYEPDAKVWDSSNGALLASFGGHTNALVAAAFSTNDSHVITLGSDRVAKLWSATNFELLKSRSVDTTLDLLGVFFQNPESTILATHEKSGQLKLVNYTTGAEFASLRGHDLWTESCAFSSNGSLVATGNADKTAKIWEVSSGKLLRSLEGHPGFVNCIAFSPTDDVILTTSNDAIRVWDAHTGELITRFEGSASSAAFSPDGERLAAGNADGIVRLWDLRRERRPPAEVARLVRDRCSWQLVNGGLLAVPEQ